MIFKHKHLLSSFMSYDRVINALLLQNVAEQVGRGTTECLYDGAT